MFSASTGLSLVGVLLTTVCAFPDLAGAQEQSSTPALATVNLRTAFKLATTPKPLYRVSYSYDFPGHRQVYIRGVGTVSSKGTLGYIHSGDTVEFFDGPDGNLLHVEKIEHAVTLMGRPALVPDETQFPRESRRGRWRGQGPFAERAFSVLDQYFRSGYRTFQKENSLVYLTTYAELPEAADGSRTEVSVLISYPVRSDSRDLAFTVAFTAQERRSHTDWRDATTDSSRNSAESFVDGLLSALQR
jgi:hypothetical protein